MAKKNPALARVLEVHEQPQVDASELRVPAICVRGHRVGWVTGFDAEGLHVDFTGNPHGPQLARLALELDAVGAARAASERRQALLAFESERSDRPIVVGLLCPAPAPSEGAAVSAAPAPSAGVPYETEVDGRRLVIEAKDEIVLRCGEASITLRRNGRLAIRGVFIETRARGVNRIKGGTVQIN